MVMLNEKDVIYNTDESKITFESLFKLYDCGPDFIQISCLQEELTILLGDLLVIH